MKTFELMESIRDLLDESKARSLIKDLKLKSGDIIPAGTKVEVEFNTKSGTTIALIRAEHKAGGRDFFAVPISTNPSNLYKLVSGFSKPPNMHTLEKWMDSGKAKSITGKNVEPDGYAPDGSPSWLIVLGYI